MDNKIIILHCVSDYPTALKDTNLSRIKLLKKKFKKNLIGISDHTNGLVSSIASVPLGIVAIEKHFKLNDALTTTDSKFSITPNQLNQLKLNILDIDYSLLKKTKTKTESESKKLRRSIFAIKNIKKDEIFSDLNIDTFRPVVGIQASKYFSVVGKKSKQNIKSEIHTTLVNIKIKANNKKLRNKGHTEALLLLSI